MGRVKQRVRVLPGGVAAAVRGGLPPIESGYQHFRLERQGALVSPRTLEYYDGMVLPFLRWLDEERTRRFEDVDVSAVRRYRALLTARPGRHGRPLQPKTLLESHRSILTYCAGRGARATRSTSAFSTWRRLACPRRSRPCTTSRSCGGCSPPATRACPHRI